MTQVSWQAPGKADRVRRDAASHFADLALSNLGGGGTRPKARATACAAMLHFDAV